MTRVWRSAFIAGLLGTTTFGCGDYYGLPYEGDYCTSQYDNICESDQGPLLICDTVYREYRLHYCSDSSCRRSGYSYFTYCGVSNRGYESCLCQ